MWYFNYIFGKIFEVIFFPFRGMSPWVGMIVVSFLTGLLMLLIFRYTSDQKGIRKVKNKIKAHLLELRLFKDDLGTTLRAQGNILRYNLKYLVHSVKPMLVMIVPVVLIIIQLNLWFGYRSLEPGESALMKVTLGEGSHPLEASLAAGPSTGAVLETPPLRMEEEGEIDWRLGGRQEGLHNLTLMIDGGNVTKEVAVGGMPLARISPVRIRKSFIDELLYPGEAPLPASSRVKKVEILYPAGRMSFFGWRVHWLVVYFVLSVIFGFAFKGFFKVEI